MKRKSIYILAIMVIALLTIFLILEIKKETTSMNTQEQSNQQENKDNLEDRKASIEVSYVAGFDFSGFTNIEIVGLDFASLSKEQASVLHRALTYIQAMIDADTETMRKIVSEDRVYVHMTGKRQSRDEYLADVKNGQLKYFSAKIENAKIEIDGDRASILYTSFLDADAYGARGVYRLNGEYYFEMRDGAWIMVNE